MFKLILLFILFTLFSINYFFWYLHTMPYFKFITKFNLYEYLIDKFDTRYGSFTGLEYKVASFDSSYILDYSWWVLVTDLKYLSPTSDNFAVYVPVFILHTGLNLVSSWDKLFTGLTIEKWFNAYYQYISWGNDYVKVGQEIVNWHVYPQTIYLGRFYTYCSMSQTWWIDAYYYDRYTEWNKKEDDKNEAKIVNGYVCPLWTKIGEYTVQVCTNYTFWVCTNYETRIYQACNCEDKWEYTVCTQNTDSATNPENKTCSDDSGKCIDYYTWTINLNNTNCSLQWLEWTGTNAKYFLLR